MEITLEKIELVKDRTGVSYKDAKEALEAAEGSVVDAIISIEESIDTDTKANVKEQGAAVIDAVKDLVNKGNVAKIVVKKNDGEVLLNLPVNAGIITAVLAPWGVLAGILSTFLFKCAVEVVKNDGEVVNVTEKVNAAAGTVSDKAGQAKEKIKESEALDKIKGAAEGLKDKAGDALDKIKRTDKDEEFEEILVEVEVDEQPQEEEAPVEVQED